MVAGRDVEQQRGVADRARDRSEAGQPVEGLGLGPRGDAAALGLQAHQPTPGGRDAAEPAPSEPIAPGTMPAATAAAAPPLEPPGVWSGSHGLRAAPKVGFSLKGQRPTSGVIVLPTITAPAARRRRTTSLSASATQCSPPHRTGSSAGEVHVVLDRNRHAEQRRALACGQARVGLRGGRACLLGEDQAERVKQRLKRLRALERGLYERGGGDLAGRDEPGPAARGRRTRAAPLAEPLDLDAPAARRGERDRAPGDAPGAPGGGEAGAPEDVASTIFISNSAKLAPRQRRTPPPNGIHS